MKCQLHCLYGFRFLMKPEAHKQMTLDAAPFLSRVGQPRRTCGEAVAHQGCAEVRTSRIAEQSAFNLRV